MEIWITVELWNNIITMKSWPNVPLTLKECNIMLLSVKKKQWTVPKKTQTLTIKVHFLIKKNLVVSIWWFSPQISTFFCKNRYPDMVLVYSIGKSVEGRDLWVTRISKQVRKSHGSRQKRQLLKPWFKIIANTHGNEVSITFLG